MSTFTNGQSYHGVEAGRTITSHFATLSASLCSIYEHLKLITMIKNISSIDLRIRPRQETSHLRPSQDRYVADSVARRIFKRSAHAPKGAHEETIFTAHRANRTDSLRSEGSSSLGSFATPEVANISHTSEQKYRKELQDGRSALLRSMNSARHIERVPYLILDERISSQLQEYAECISIFDALSMDSSNEELNDTTVIPTPLQDSIRLVSPSGLGGLACAELWCGGKYKRHAMTRVNDRVHPRDCVCHLHIVWQHIVDSTHRYVGIGRSEDGRWLVELRKDDKVKSDLPCTTVSTQPVINASSWRSKSVVARKPLSLPSTAPPPPPLHPGARISFLAERPRRWDSLPGFNARPYLNTLVEDDFLTPATSILNLKARILSRASSWETMLPTPRISTAEAPQILVNGISNSTISRSSSWETLNTMRELSLQILQHEQKSDDATALRPHSIYFRASASANMTVRPLSVVKKSHCKIAGKPSFGSMSTLASENEELWCDYVGGRASGGWVTSAR
ncbi:hypothetical protein LTR78_001405 [Recurvomyces mirabilis]|uniref:Uncharacterized protein n=1 Tax=Recurvomyces mirabilis TaxID=574656 RepID=A0AAE0WVC4_9PEZI|nr:hypothetical protein LTR78_001405 [Recurvomyces mirabilis]KAK5161382.1 hypothetical protein LTS14_001178 [Recurvomyces mirabilis]